MILITPTGARPKQIYLCAEFMKHQDYQGPVTWIIVDDCEPVTTDFIKDNFRPNWNIIKVYPKPKWQEGQNTQGRNLCAGLTEAKKHKAEAIFIIEDDDYYKPCYLRIMKEKLSGYDIAGETRTVYYNVVSRRWVVNGNDPWSSLFQTAFKPSVIPFFEKCYGEKFIDLVLWKLVKKQNLFNDGNLSIGIKGQNGRAGIGAGHNWIRNMNHDPDFVKLREFIGNDVKYYDGSFSCR